MKQLTLDQLDQIIQKLFHDHGDLMQPPLVKEGEEHFSETDGIFLLPNNCITGATGWLLFKEAVSDAMQAQPH